MSWRGRDDPGGGFGYDNPWWTAEEARGTAGNRTWEERCRALDYDYHVVTAVICGMFLVFGIVYSLFDVEGRHLTDGFVLGDGLGVCVAYALKEVCRGDKDGCLADGANHMTKLTGRGGHRLSGYRCFKAVMFLTGFIFASVVVYLICLSEDLLPLMGNAGVALGAGVMFGLITMLVQYVGLFMTGLHTGLFLGVAGIAIAYNWWVPSSVWPVVGILLAAGLLLAILTLYFQKGLTILGTAISGGAIMSATLDYFIEKFLMVHWFEDRLKAVESERPCWFSWMILGVWPFMVVVGSLTQWRITGRGIYHQQLVPSKKSRSVNLQRMRSREARAEMRQKKYRYLYQVRTAHGDIISQEYIQSLQRKAYPTGDNGTMQSDSTHTTMLPPEHAQLAPLTESEDETGGSQPPPTPPEPPRFTRVTMH